MKLSLVYLFLLAMISFGPIAGKAEEVTDWVQEKNMNPKAMGVSTGAALAAGSLAIGAYLSHDERAAAKSLAGDADLNGNYVLYQASEPYIKERNRLNLEMDPLIEELNQSKQRLEYVVKQEGSNTGVATGLVIKIEKIQNHLKLYENQRNAVLEKLDEIRDFLAKGKTGTLLSVKERGRLIPFIERFHEEEAYNAHLYKIAADLERESKVTFKRGAKRALLGVPVGMGVTFIGEIMLDRALANQKNKKARPEPAENAVNRSPAVLGPATAEAK